MNRTVHKTVPLLHAKALTDKAAPGTFEAVWAVFGNEDSDGDIVHAGAFLDSWARKMPKVVWSHSWLEVPIGVTLELDEFDLPALKRLLPNGVPEGVSGAAWGKARLAVDVASGEDNPRAREVYTALKMVGGDGRAAIDEFSWGGRVTRESVEKRQSGVPVWHIESVEQAEWGPCLKGANPATALIAAKSSKFNLERAVRIANGDAVEGASPGDQFAARKLSQYRALTLEDAREAFGLESKDDGDGTHNPLDQPRQPAQPHETIPADNPETDPPQAPVQPSAPVVDPEQRALVADLLFAG
jgi:hypothetical protein